MIHLKFWKAFLETTLMLFSRRKSLSSFIFIFVKLSSMFSILLFEKSSVFSDFMLEMAIKGIFPRRLLARLRCDSTGTPFWKAIEWIFMMLFLLRSRLNNCFRFQKTPSGTEVSELPARISVSREVERLFRSNCSMSEIWLSETDNCKARDCFNNSELVSSLAR